MRQALILILLLPLLSLNCKRLYECETVHHAPQDFLDYWYFPEGSWWVYQMEGDTSLRDTVTVYNSHTDYEMPRQHLSQNSPCSMEYWTNWRHSDTIHFKGEGKELPRQSLHAIAHFSGQWTVFYVPQMDLAPSGDFFFYPFKIGERGRAADFTVIDTDSLMISSDSLTAGVHIRAKQHPDLQCYRDIYFAKALGITRFTVDTNSTWNLINYQIKK